MTNDKIQKFLNDNKTHILKDGIYRVNSKYIKLQECLYSLLEQNNQKLKTFIKEHPDYGIASGYETYTTILFEKLPKPFYGKIEGSGFNYGSTNVISEIDTDSLLIIAEND